MLGIGFIIAHFVAMQKPQQRKYHSSCNRSVHRGTAHGKQEVKVCKRKTPHLLVRSFLSPYGDGTVSTTAQRPTVSSFRPLTGMVRSRDMIISVGISFRPLTGMVLSSRIYKRSPVQFSPPYGDGTSWLNLDKDELLFSPPYGDGTFAKGLYSVTDRFSPPYGDGTFRPTFDPNRR